MICQRMMVRGVRTVPDVWQFTVNTEATSAGGKKTGIPFNLYGQDSVVLTVDWGDGNTSTLTSANYTADNSLASVHEYTEAGEYQITISSKTWEKTSPLIMYPNGTASEITTPNNLNEPLYWFRRTIVSVDTKIPKLFGTRQIASRNVTTITSSLQGNCFPRIFLYCKKLISIPDDILSLLYDATDFLGLFQGTGLSSIPDQILSENSSITTLAYFLYNCNNLNDFTITIKSSNVSACNSFVLQKSTPTRTIYVPSGSTTEATFNAVASSLGLTIIGE